MTAITPVPVTVATIQPTPQEEQPDDYTGIVDRALESRNFGALQAAAFQTVNALFADPGTSVSAVRWLQEYAGNKAAIDDTLQRFLCFIVVAPELLTLNGALAKAEPGALQLVLGRLLGAYVVAAERAKGGA